MRRQAKCMCLCVGVCGSERAPVRTLSFDERSFICIIFRFPNKMKKNVGRISHPSQRRCLPLEMMRIKIDASLCETVSLCSIYRTGVRCETYTTFVRETMLHFVKYEPNRSMLIGNRTRFVSKRININGTRHESQRICSTEDTVISPALSLTALPTHLRIPFALENLSIHLKRANLNTSTTISKVLHYTVEMERVNVRVCHIRRRAQDRTNNLARRKQTRMHVIIMRFMNNEPIYLYS